MLSRFLLGTMILWRVLLRKPLSGTRAFQPCRQPRLSASRMTWLSEYPCRVPPNLSFIQATPSLGRIQYRSSSSSSFSTAIQSTTESDTSTADAGSSIILQDLNPSQVEAVTQPLSAITRVVAGPGSGKTRVLTCRIAYLLEEDPTNRILGVTFTRKAAGEMQKRLEKLLVEQQQQQLMESSSTDPHDRQTPDQDGEIVQETVGGDDGSAHPEGLSRAMLGTFHSICAKILRWNGDLLGSLPTVIEDMAGSRNVTFLDGNFAIVDQGEQLRILKESLKEVDVDLKDYDNLKPFAVLAAISDCKSKIAEGKNPFQANADSRKPLPKAVKVAHKVYPLYREKLLATNCIDFDDLIYMARELLFEHEEVRERLQRRWTHILVDEFQDTSRSQMDLIKLLTASSLFVVGDADQSIYSWRGAHVGSLSDFADEFQGYLGGVHTVYLMENYRSTSNIVNAAQKVISASSGKSSSGADKLRKNMKPKRGSGATPRIIACKDEKAEADFVVKQVKDLVNSGEYNPDNSAAFIYRTNAQSRALEEACVTHNLHYVIFGSATSFYKRQEIKDCLGFLRWMYNGRDRSSMLRSMQTPSRGLGEVAIREFDRYCDRIDEFFEANYPGSPGPTPFDVLLLLSSQKPLSEELPLPSASLSTRPLKLLSAFSQQMRSIRDMAYTLPVERVLSLIIESLELTPHFDKISKTKDEFEERQANVRELRKASERYSKQGPCLSREDGSAQDIDEFTQSPLGIFLDDVSLVTEMADAAEQSADKRFVASLMTIHASKGMEFDAVFVVGNEDGTFPTSQALQEGDGSVVLEEERRLCYVAMTRARSQLFMTWRREVNIFTPDGIRTVDKDRSRFLDVLVSSKGKKTNGAGSKSTSGSRSGSPRTRGGEPTFRDTSKYRSPASRSQRPTYETSSNLSPKRPSAQFEGTASVYAKKRPSSLDQAISSETGLPKRSTRRLPTATRPVEQRAPPSQRPTTPPLARQPSEQRAPPSKRPTTPPPARQPFEQRAPPSKRSTTPPPARKTMDSTWFFPVGSEVAHKNHGRGIVLPPPQSRDKAELPVLVKFGDGEREFCARGSELTPIVP